MCLHGNQTQGQLLEAPRQQNSSRADPGQVFASGFSLLRNTISLKKRQDFLRMLSGSDQLGSCWGGCGWHLWFWSFDSSRQELRELLSFDPCEFSFLEGIEAWFWNKETEESSSSKCSWNWVAYDAAFLGFNCEKKIEVLYLNLADIIH